MRHGARALAATIAGALAATTLTIATAPSANAAPVDIQILGINDFHGRIVADGTQAGAAKLAGVVDDLEASNPNTVFAAAGDLIGASTFESFIQKDKPTIDALNAAGLDVSAVGNHELDQGYGDLVNRVMAPYDATTNPFGGAQWHYVAANLTMKAGGPTAIPRSWTTTVGGVEIGFVGAVTEELPSLVSPGGIADIAVNSIVASVNAEADALTAGGADLVVLLVHEGAATTSLASATDPASAFGKIVNGVDSDVDAIISGHTHLAYNHLVERGDHDMPVVSAGQYGVNLNQLVFTVDPVAGTVVAKPPVLVPVASAPGTPDPAVTAIVDAAKAQADVLGAQPLGRIAAAFGRARLSQVVGDTDENRGGESTLGNLVAEVHRWATSSATSGGAQIAFMNPGGLRTDLTAATYPATLTYRQAANVQPFANTLVNMRLTGAQIKTVLEQQWQRDGSGNVPTRPFLRLGTSKGFRATYDATRPEGDRVTGMWLGGAALVPATSYSVTVNSFLASGGDNFRELAKGTDKRDTGKVDLQAMVDYLAEFASPAGDPPLPVNYAQHQVGVSRPAGAATFYRIGQKLDLRLSSLRMTAKGDRVDTQLAPKIGSIALTRAKLDNTVGTVPFDEYGKALVDARLNVRVPTGNQVLTLSGPATGTVVRLPIQVRKAKPTLRVKVWPKRVRVDRTKPRVKIRLVAEGIDKVQGKVRIKVGGRTYLGTLQDGKVKVTLREFGNRGQKKMEIKYLGTKAVKSVRTSVKVRVRR